MPGGKAGEGEHVGFGIVHTGTQLGPARAQLVGGVTAEILQDVYLITPDMPEEQVVAKLLALKQAPLLTGWRGSPALDLLAFSKLIVRTGQIMLGNPDIREIDLNLVILHAEGQGVVPLDALMLVG